MGLLTNLATGDEEPGAVGRHAILLASLLALFVILPAFRSIPGGSLRFSILLSAVLTAAIYVNSRRRWALWLGLLFGGGAIASTAGAEATGVAAWRVLATGLGFVLLVFTTFTMLNTLVRAERVSRDTIIGGICVYLMMGLAFALAYLLILHFDPGALQAGGVALGEAFRDNSTRSAKVLYFSFVTLTTLGFGDITPDGEVAEMVVTAEAIIGQLYVAIFIARLMSLYMAGDREDRIKAMVSGDSDAPS